MALARVDLELQLANGQQTRRMIPFRIGIGMGGNEGSERFKLAAFNIDFEDVDECVPLFTRDQVRPIQIRNEIVGDWCTHR